MPEAITVSFTTDPDDLKAVSDAYMATVNPGFDGGAATQENFLSGAFARIAAILMDLATDVPPAIFRYLGLKIFNIPAIEDVPSSGTVTVTMTGTPTMPMGTGLAIADVGGNYYGFVTTDDLTGSGTVGIVATVVGSAANGLTGDAELRDNGPFGAAVTSITLTAPTASGTDAEDDDTYQNRLRGELQILSPRFVLARDAAILAQSVEGVFRAVAIDNYDTAHNLLTVNQASLETNTTGWAAGANCTIGRNTAHAADGVASLSLTSTASGDMTATTTTGTGGEVVEPGVTYTARLQSESASSVRSFYAGIEWFDSGGTPISTVYGSATVESASSFLPVASVTAAAPSNAAYAAVVAKVAATGGASEVHYVDMIAFREGADISWKPGGSPATGVEKMITICGIDETGAALSSLIKSAMVTLLESDRELNFEVNTTDPTYTAVDVAFTAVAEDGFDAPTVQSQAEAAITAYLDPATWGQPQFGDQRDWALISIVRYLEVAQVINQVDGIDYIQTLTIAGAAADLQLYGIVPLPTAGTISGTVTAPS